MLAFCWMAQLAHGATTALFIGMFCAAPNAM